MKGTKTYKYIAQHSGIDNESGYTTRQQSVRSLAKGVCVKKKKGGYSGIDRAVVLEIKMQTNRKGTNQQ